MKTSTMLVSALAAVASALPSLPRVHKRNNVSLESFNSFSFANQDLQYLNAINQFDLQAFEQLAAFNNLQISQFEQLFTEQSLDVNALLQLQQVAMLAQLAQLGLFSNFDLSSVDFQVINFGLAMDLCMFDLSNVLSSSLEPQLAQVISSTSIQTVTV
ncbi:hypothetical protein F5Y16DRAFT_235831 [Xylariaceae sp. FL0255]|nr:hypothetical protein F5Y16DRAFT_235831 [Xylariaceae sp. FL0255]